MPRSSRSGRAIARFLALPLAGALSLVGCDACSPPVSDDVHVDDVPVTLDSLRARAEEEGWPVEQQTITRARSTGGGACGHSPICILVPIGVAVGALFPSRYELVTARDGERVMYQGAFHRGSGALIYLRARDGEEWRDVRALNLPRLGRHPIIEVGRIAILPDGGDGRERRTPILTQVDLLADYDRALADAEPGTWEPLFAEALRELGDEAKGWGTRRLRAPETTDAHRVGLFHRLCRLSTSDEDVQRHVVTAVLEGASAEVLDAALLCETQRSRVIEHVLARVCDPDRDPAPYLRLDGIVQPGPARALPNDTPCAAPRSTLVALWRDEEISERALRDAMDADAFADAYLHLLRRSVPHERAVLFERLEAATDAAGRDAAMEPLLYGDTRLSAEELATSARAYRAIAAEEPAELGGLPWLMARAREDTPTTAAERVLADDPEADARVRQRLAVGRILLGDAGAVSMAIEGIESAEVRWTDVHLSTPGPGSRARPRRLRDQATLTAWSLHAAGCPNYVVRRGLGAGETAALEPCVASGE